MRVAGLAAVWFAILLVAPNVAWLLVCATMVVAIAAVRAQLQPLFWLPCVVCLNWIVLNFTAWWIPPPELFVLLGLGFVSITAISVFTFHRTRLRYRNSPTRDGVLFAGIGNGCIAGFVVGLMIGIPLLGAGLLSLFVISPIDLDFGGRMAIGFPLLGSIAGLAIGIGLGFVCDIVVASDFRNRRRQPLAR